MRFSDWRRAAKVSASGIQNSKIGQCVRCCHLLTKSVRLDLIFFSIFDWNVIAHSPPRPLVIDSHDESHFQCVRMSVCLYRSWIRLLMSQCLRRERTPRALIFIIDVTIISSIIVISKAIMASTLSLSPASQVMLISFVYYFAVTIQEVESVWCCVVNVDDDIYDFLSTKFSIFKADQSVLLVTRPCIPFQGHLVLLEWNTKWLFCSLRLRSMHRPTNYIHYAFILLEYQTVNVHNGRYMERYFMSLTKKEAERFNRRNRSIIRSLCGHHSEMLLFRPGNSWTNIEVDPLIRH